MGVKYLIFLIIVMVLISACSTEKTKPIVTDIEQETKEEPIKVEEKETPEENETIEEEIIEEKKESKEEVELEEGEEEKILPPGTHMVTIKDLKLDPQELTIKKGDTIIWKHEDEWEKEGATRHLLYQHFNVFRSPLLYYGDTFNHTFTEEGTFTYQDAMYKEKDNMRGKIIVE